MWYKLNEDKTKIVNVAPANKMLDDGTTIMNYNLDSERLIADGYIEYTGKKPESQLKVVDGKIVEKTEEELSQESENIEKSIYESYYVQNPDLTRCIKEYKSILDAYKLDYTATTADISNAILADETKTDMEKAVYGFQIQSIWNNVVLNLEYVHINNALLYAWQNMPKLIKYLPDETDENSFKDISISK